MASGKKTSVNSSGIGKRRSAAKNEPSESYQARRAEIAAAAVRVFNQLGFQGASMSAVATELGIDRASLYYYISSKEELFDVVISEVIERNASIASRILASKMSPGKKIHETITALMKSYGDSYPLIYIFIRENLSHVSDRRSEWSKRMRQLSRKIENAIIAMIEEGYASKAFRRVGPSRVVAYGILGIIGWTHRWFRPDRSVVSAEEIGQIYADIIVSGLSAKAD